MPRGAVMTIARNEERNGERKGIGTRRLLPLGACATAHVADSVIAIIPVIQLAVYCVRFDSVSVPLIKIIYNINLLRIN
jgi:hypothetical protein